MQKAKVKRIESGAEGGEIVVVISARDSMYMAEKVSGWPCIVNSIILENGINRLLEFQAGGKIEEINTSKAEKELAERVRELLSAFDYDRMNDYQGKCALLVERALRKL